MKTSQKGIELIKKHEGMRNNVYRCPAGVPTIGYGATFYPDGRKVSMDDEPITAKQAEDMLKATLEKFEKDVFKAIYPVKDRINQNQFDALVSFAYNVGIGAFYDSTLLKKVRVNPNDPTIEREFNRWVFAAGRELPGLRKRRQEEADLYEYKEKNT